MVKRPFATPENETRTPAQEQDAVAARAEKGSGRFLRAVGLILGREYKNQVTQRSFRIGTIITLVLLVIAACVPTAIEYFTSSAPPAQTKIAVVNNAGPIAGLSGDALAKQIETSLNQAGAQPATVISTDSANSVAGAQQQIKDGKLTMALVIDRSAAGDLSFTQYTKTADAASSTLPQIRTAAMQLNLLDKGSGLNLTPEQAQSLTTQPEVNTVALQQEQDSRSVGERVAGYVIAYIGIILISMSVFMYGNIVAQGVAEEKGGRIMELLINAATPFQLMAGKILGIGAAALTQIATFVIVGIGAILLQAPIRALLLGNASGGLHIDVASVSLAPLLLLVLYFLLGFLLYATLFAGVGALVRRQDEAQNAISPITLFFTAGYMASFIAIYVPDAAWVKVMSYIPFWTPVLMIVRAGVSSVAWWEIVITAGLMVLTIIICTLLAARIYRLGVLMYGQKPGLASAVKLLRKQ